MKLKIRMYKVEWRIDKGRKKQMRSRSKNLKIVMQRFFILGNKNEKKKKMDNRGRDRGYDSSSKQEGCPARAI